jgi:outer membrane protein assembly factor BamB
MYAVDIATHQLAWVVTLGIPTKGAYAWSSPLVLNGSVYIGLASHDDNPCVRSGVFAFDEQTGIAKWTHYTVPQGVLGGGVWSSVTADVAHHLIIATTGNPCPEGPVGYEEDSIVAMDWDTGKTVWMYQALATDTCDCDFGEGAVIYSIGGREFVVAGSKYGQVYAVSPGNNGQPPALAWSQRISFSGFVGKGGIFTPPTYADGMLLAAGGPTLDGACPHGALHGFKADTGALVWRVCTASPVIGAPAASGGAVFVAAAGKLTAYNIQTGKQLWQANEAGTEIWGGVAISHGFVLSGTLPGTLFAYALPKVG